MSEKKDYKIYEKAKGSEELRQLESQDSENINIDELNKTIKLIENKLKNLGAANEFFLANLNSYLKEKFGASFENKNGSLILVFDEAQKSLISELSSKLKVSDSSIFLDENQNNKKDLSEIGIEFSSKSAFTDSIYLSELEKKSKQVEFGERNILDESYTQGGKLVLDGNNVYYEVGDNIGGGKYDHLSAVSRLFTALSDEYFGGLNLEQINQRIQKLYYNPKTNEFRIFNQNPETGYEHVGDINSKKWWSIVKPGSRINITSLSGLIKQEASKVGLSERKVSPESNERKTSIDWGRFYIGLNGETYDVPDTWKNIKYDGYSKSYSGLNGSQISIGAKSMYDIGDKSEGALGKNTFSLKEEIKIGDKKAFLIVGEGLKDVGKINKKDENSIRKSLENSKTEAWLIIPENNGKVSIKEVGDRKVHTITETSDKVERGEDKEHPIVLDGLEYRFSGKVNGSIKFEEKNGKVDFTSPTIEGLNEKNFKDVFAGTEGYLQVSGHIIKISLDNSNKIKIEDLGENKKGNYEYSGFSLFSDNFSGFEFKKDTGYIKFPDLNGWGSLDANIGKQKDNLIITLGEDYKIGDRKLNINLGKIDGKLSPSDIQSKITSSLLFLEMSKDTLNNKALGADNSVNYDEKNINIKLPNNLDNLSKFIDKNIDGLLTRERGESEKTYIFDKIKKDIETRITKK